MGRALAIFGMVASGLLLVVFSLDMALGLPFYGASTLMDVCFIICSAILGYLSWSTFQEQM